MTYFTCMARETLVYDTCRACVFLLKSTSLVLLMSLDNIDSRLIYSQKEESIELIHRSRRALGSHSSQVISVTLLRMI